jgi:heme exporter protein A
LTSPLLELRQLSCERDERILFSRLDTQCFAGDLVQVVGPNGAGKTSLLRCLAGISNDYHGQILWQGQPVSHCRWEYARSLLFLGHLPGIKKALTPLENLRWYAALNRPTAETELLSALTAVGLYAYEETPCYQLSAGQLRRVALARLYLSDARLWILDEPFTAIDKKGVADLQTLLTRHRERGGLVILTSHQDLPLIDLKRICLSDFQIAVANEACYDPVRR